MLGLLADLKFGHYKCNEDHLKVAATMVGKAS